MAKMIPMKTIWKARNMVLSGRTIEQISKELGVSASTLTKYTKYERAKMKQTN